MSRLKMEQKEKPIYQRGLIEHYKLELNKDINFIKKYKSLILFIIILIAFAVLITEVKAEIVFKAETQSDVKVPCYDSYNFCPATTYCNLTVNYPNGSNLVDSVKMTRQISYYNYTLNENQTIVTGDYSAFTFCANGTDTGTYDFTFYVDPEGYRPGNDVIVPAIIILLPIILSFIFLFIAATMHEDHQILKNFMQLFAILPIFVSLNFGMIALIRFYHAESLIDMIGSTVWWLGITFFVILTYFIIYYFTVAVHVAAGKKKARLNY